jgi:hypothetical protein
MEYYPDKWVLLKITNNSNEETHYRVFASFYGGYTGSDSWRMNSGITAFTELENHYSFTGNTGSAYICGKKSYGTSMYALGILNSMIESASTNGVTIEVLPAETSPTQLKFN